MANRSILCTLIQPQLAICHTVSYSVHEDLEPAISKQANEIQIDNKKETAETYLKSNEDKPSFNGLPNPDWD